MSTLDVVSVNHNRRLALFSDDQIGEIHNWWTPDGTVWDEPPPNPVSCIARHPSGKWLTADLREFKQRHTKH